MVEVSVAAVDLHVSHHRMTIVELVEEVMELNV